MQTQTQLAPHSPERNRQSDGGRGHHFGGHHFQELVEIDRPIAVPVDVADHFLNLLLLGLEAERTHHHQAVADEWL